MICLLALMGAVVLLDLYTEWVTPYLEEVERSRGRYVALAEAVRILAMAE